MKNFSFVASYSKDVKINIKNLWSLHQMEMRGIEPRASRMQSERSTMWATSPFAYFVV